MTFSPSWLTSTTVAVARGIREGHSYEQTPVLADALEDAGCEVDLAPLRSGLNHASLLWLAAILDGMVGLWEWGMLGEKFNRLIEGEFLVLPETPKGAILERIRARRTELQRLHTGECKTCEGAGDGWPCPTCVLAVRERWDRLPCQKCLGTGWHRYQDFPDGKPNFSDSAPCGCCGGVGDLLRRPTRDDENDTIDPYSRPLSFSGPLPAVGATVDEIGRVATVDERKTYGCEFFPSPWLRALPLVYEVRVEGVEPYIQRGESQWYDDAESSGIHTESDLPTWAFRILPGEVGHKRKMKIFPSPSAAHTALSRALLEWRVRGLQTAAAPRGEE